MAAERDEDAETRAPLAERGALSPDVSLIEVAARLQTEAVGAVAVMNLFTWRRRARPVPRPRRRVSSR